MPRRVNPSALVSHLYRVLCLVLLVIAAQQGAVVHEVGHLSGSAHGANFGVESGAIDGGCALCPAFAQVVSPAFSHSIPLPPLVRAELERSPEPRLEAIGSPVLTPRNRGPPSRS
jgi:hypothetical protein